MNRDFEVRQLLRAYRSGLMSETAFEEEMTRLEHETGEPGQPVLPPGFEVFGRSYRSEREAVISFLDELHATQMDLAIGFAKWSAACRTMGLRTGLMMAAERSAYHSRVIERRVHELGGELHVTTSEHGGKVAEVLANGEVSDLEKLLALTSLIQDPQQVIAPIVTFASALRKDVETKQALRLFAEDELSTVAWLHDICAALTAAEVPATSSNAQRPPRA